MVISIILVLVVTFFGLHEENLKIILVMFFENVKMQNIFCDGKV